MVVGCFPDYCVGVSFLCRMSHRGRGKGKTLVKESGALEESGWQGMQVELQNLVHRISHAFGRGGSSESSRDLWLHQLSKLCAPMFKVKGGPEESKACLQRIVKMLESMACLEEHWVRLATSARRRCISTWLCQASDCGERGKLEDRILLTLM